MIAVGLRFVFWHRTLFVLFGLIPNGTSRNPHSTINQTLSGRRVVIRENRKTSRTFFAFLKIGTVFSKRLQYTTKYLLSIFCSLPNFPTRNCNSLINLRSNDERYPFDRLRHHTKLAKVSCAKLRLQRDACEFHSEHISRPVWNKKTNDIPST